MESSQTWRIITPNKWANALLWRRYESLMGMLDGASDISCSRPTSAPDCRWSRRLRSDRQRRRYRPHRGNLSGTFSYLFNTFDGPVPFSELVRDAHNMGYTEPDPREDLSVQDVARKLLILGRQIGLELDLHEVNVDSLVPEPLARGKYTSEFLPRSPPRRGDGGTGDARRRARQRPELVGTLEGGKGSAGLKEFPARTRLRQPRAATTSSASDQALRKNAAGRPGPRRRRRRHRDGRLLRYSEAAELPAALNLRFLEFRFQQSGGQSKSDGLV